MKYYKYTDNGYILAVGTGGMGVEITEAEHTEIMDVIANKPQETAEIGYRLKTDLTWESYEKEPPPDPSKEEVPDSEALEILLGGAV